MTLSRQGAGRRHRFENPPGSPPAGGSRLDWAAFSWRRFRDGRTQGEGLPPGARPAQGRGAGRARGPAPAGRHPVARPLLLPDPPRRAHPPDRPFPLRPRLAQLPCWAPAATRRQRSAPTSCRRSTSCSSPTRTTTTSTGRPWHALPGREEATIVTGLGMRRYLDDLGYGRRDRARLAPDARPWAACR